MGRWGITIPAVGVCQSMADSWENSTQAGSDFETDEECERDKSGGRIYDGRKTEDRI